MNERNPIMEKVQEWLLRGGAAVLSVLIAWKVLVPNWEISGAPNLPAALTDPSFWVFWVGTFLVLLGLGVLIGRIPPRENIGVAILLTGLLLVVNGMLTAERVSLTLFGVLIAVFGAWYYWKNKPVSEPDVPAAATTRPPGIPVSSTR